MSSYKHGGNIYEFAKLANCKVEDVIDFSSNINFIKPNINLNFNNLNTSAYPEPNYIDLKEAIKKRYKIDSISQIELFNGGSSAIFSLFKFLNLKTCNIYSPAYLEYKKASKLFGYELNLINRFENLYEYKKIKKNSLVIFVNPSTPDGKLYNHKNIEKLLNIWIEKNATILIDESFLDFTKEKSLLTYINRYKKLYILKSMTKFYSSAGIRVGVLISNKDNIKNLKKFEPSWKISTYDSNYIIEVLKDKNFIKKSIKINNQNRKFLREVLINSNLFEKVYKSKANYILAKLKNGNAKEFQKFLTSHNILIRDCFNFDFLNDKFIRFAVKERDKIKRLREVLLEFTVN